MSIEDKFLRQENLKIYEPKVGDRVMISDPDNHECHGAAGEVYWVEEKNGDTIVSVATDGFADVWEGDASNVEPEKSN